MTDFAGPPKSEPDLDLPEPEAEPPVLEPGPPAPASEAAALEPEAHARPLEPVASGPPPPSVETTRRLLGASFDLLGRASDDMRRASFYIGLIVLVMVGPLALATLAIETVSIHKTGDEMAALYEAGLEAWEGLLAILFALGLLAAYFESRIMAATILGAHWVGRPVSVRGSLARSRMAFLFVVIAWFIVLIPVLIAQSLLSIILTEVVGEQTDFTLVTSVLVSGLVGAPFVYLLSGVVLGDVDPVEATVRSFRVFRARKLAAALAAIFETTAILLVFLGFSAGSDIALRVLDSLGLSLDSGPAGFLLIAFGLLVGVFALGTLIYTAFAISVAPQVVMFVGLTHATFGLDHVRPGGDRDPEAPRDRARPFHWVTWPMRIAFALGILGLVGVVATLLG